MNALAAYSEVNMDPPSPDTFIYLFTYLFKTFHFSPNLQR